MKSLPLHVLLLVVAMLVPAAGSSEDEPTAREILDRVSEQPTPKSSAVQMKMILISHRGDKTFKQERKVEMFAKQGDEGMRTLLKFKEPKDVEGVALLVRENPDGPDDQWLYMPALKQEPKRISGGQRNQSFLGTDFTFADLAGRDPDEWNHKLLREEQRDGHEFWVIESTPKEGTETQYSRLVQWIRKDDMVPTRIEFFQNDGLLKVFTAEKVEKIDGYQVASRTRMENVVKKHATVLEILNQKNNLDFPPRFFTQREMKK